MFMVSKNYKGAFYAPFFFLLASAFLLGTSAVSAQNIAKYYNSKTQEGSTLYHIFPTSGFKNGSNEFIYDLTYLTTNDSVTFNFSYFDAAVLTMDSITIEGEGVSFTSDLKRFFVETKKSKWHYRYSASVPFADLRQLYGQEHCPTILLHTKQGDIKIGISQKTWNKQRSIIHKIIDLITYNQ